MKLYWAKWAATIQVNWSNLMVYRTNFLLQSIAPLFVFLVVKLSLWYKILGEGQQSVEGYDFPHMANYHFWILIASILIFNSNATHISEDIRLGRITSYLIYPFQLWEFHGAGFIAKLMIHLLISGVTLVGAWLVLGNSFHLPFLTSLASGLTLCLLGALFWFWANFIVGLVGFWLEETWTLMVILKILTYFLSGAIIPLSLYPDWMQSLLVYSPFPYIAYYPAQIFLGHPVQLGSAFSILLLWTWVMILLSLWVWKKGIRLYTAAGM